MRNATRIPAVGAAVRHPAEPLNPRALLVLLGAALLATLAAGTPANARSVERDGWERHAEPTAPFEMWTEGRLVDVQVRVDGEPAPLYLGRREADRRYLQAFEGRPYSIVVRNVSARRVAVAIAVDGLNVLNGERSTLSSREPLYVLDPRETTVIRGWRTSLAEVRRFVFVDERRSYAERSDRANADMGGIRIASFRERQPWWSTRERVRVSPPLDATEPRAAAPAPEADLPEPRTGASKEGVAAPQRAVPPPAESRAWRDDGDPRDGSLPGTGWGDRREDRVATTRFVASGPAVDRVVLRYEYASGLRALGIRPVDSRWHDRLAEREFGFARPPIR